MKRTLYCILVFSAIISMACFSELAFGKGGGGSGASSSSGSGAGGTTGAASSSSGTGSGAHMSVGGSTSGMGHGTGTGHFGAGIGGTGTGRGSSMRSDTGTREGVPESGFNQQSMGRSFEQREGPTSGFDQRQFGRSFDEGVPSGESADQFNQNREFEFNRQQGINDGTLDRRDLDRGANTDDRFLNEEQREGTLNEEQRERLANEEQRERLLNEERRELNISPEEQLEQQRFNEQLNEQPGFNEEFREGVSPQTGDQFIEPFTNEGRPSDQFGNPLPFGSSIPNNQQQDIIHGNVIPPENRLSVEERQFSNENLNGNIGSTDRDMQFSDQDFNRDFDRFSSDNQF